MTTIQETINDLVDNPFSIKMLYVGTSGSHLYGSSTPASDWDYKGIFLPSNPHHPFFATKKKHTQPHAFEITTGSDTSSNGADDIDQAYFSVQKFFSNLSKGEAGAMDLLFSMWNPEHTVQQDIHFVNWCKENYLKLITRNPSSFIGFATGQARRYGVKGERYNELVGLIDIIDTIITAMSEPLTIGDPRVKKPLKIHINKVMKWNHIKFTQAPSPRGQEGDWTYLEVLGKQYIAIENSTEIRKKKTAEGIA